MHDDAACRASASPPGVTTPRADALARADGGAQRFHSLSAQIQRQRRDHYDVLERTQKGTLDVAPPGKLMRIDSGRAGDRMRDFPIRASGPILAIPELSPPSPTFAGEE